MQSPAPERSLPASRSYKQWRIHAAGIAAVSALCLAVWWAQQRVPEPSFVSIAPNVWRYSGPKSAGSYYTTPVPIHSYLLSQDSSWLLVNSGPLGSQGQAYSSGLVAALRTKLPSEEVLSAILGDSLVLHSCLQQSCWHCWLQNLNKA